MTSLVTTATSPYLLVVRSGWGSCEAPCIATCRSRAGLFLVSFPPSTPFSFSVASQWRHRSNFPSPAECLTRPETQQDLRRHRPDEEGNSVRRRSSARLDRRRGDLARRRRRTRARSLCALLCASVMRSLDDGTDRGACFVRQMASRQLAYTSSRRRPTRHQRLWRPPRRRVRHPSGGHQRQCVACRGSCHEHRIDLLSRYLFHCERREKRVCLSVGRGRGPSGYWDGEVMY